MTYVNYFQYKIQYNEKSNSAMRVAGLAVFIVWRYSKPQVPAARIEHVCGCCVQHMLNIKRFIAFAGR